MKGQLQLLEQVECERIKLSWEKSKKAQPKFSFKIEDLQESVESECSPNDCVLSSLPSIM